VSGDFPDRHATTTAAVGVNGNVASACGRVRQSMAWRERRESVPAPDRQKYAVRSPRRLHAQSAESHSHVHSIVELEPSTRSNAEHARLRKLHWDGDYTHAGGGSA